MKDSVVKRFLSYVEITTKITSLAAFFMAIGFLYYKKQSINVELTAVFFVSMFLFDLTTTAVNNYIDTRTNTQVLQFERRTAFFIIAVLLFISAALGLYLAWRTDLLVLLLGGLCFVCGVFYTYGPVPISRQPLGEIFSGVFYGLLIPFLLCYINMPEGTYFAWSISARAVDVRIMLRPAAELLLVCAAPVLTTANIMLANNICDVEKDARVKRYTLPYYLGDKAVVLFGWLYYAVYVSALLLVVFGILPLLYLAIFLTLVPVERNIRQFRREQRKETTFVKAISNFCWIMGADILLLFLCA